MRPFYENRKKQRKFSVQADICSNLNFLAHWHPDVELVYVLKGTVRVGINQEVRVLGKGDFAVCSSGQIHFYDSSNMDSKIILLLFNPQLVGFPDGWPDGKHLKSPFIQGAASGVPEQLKKLLSSILHETRKPDSLSEYFITGWVYEICGLILRHIPAVEYKADGSSRIKDNIISTMHEILNFIDSSYTTDITISDISRKFSISESYLTRLFKATIGMSFSSYIQGKRILRAEYLLRQFERPVSEIAFECGFESIRTFNRLFKTANGFSPTEFRRKCIKALPAMGSELVK